MKHHNNLTANDFDALLELFSLDRDKAGEQYEDIRSGLVRYFQFKGCSDPEQLTDETINRVAAKIHSFDVSRNIRPASFFYGFATNVLLEYRRIAKREFSLSEGEFAVGTAVEDSDPNDTENTCLQKCLANLSEFEREMIIDYYTADGQAKMELRRKMCERIQCSAGALHTKIFRIKAALRICIEGCVGATA